MKTEGLQVTTGVTSILNWSKSSREWQFVLVSTPGWRHGISEHLHQEGQVESPSSLYSSWNDWRNATRSPPARRSLAGRHAISLSQKSRDCLLKEVETSRGLTLPGRGMPLDPWIVDKERGKYTNEVWPRWLPNISWICDIVKRELPRRPPSRLHGFQSGYVRSLPDVNSDEAQEARAPPAATNSSSRSSWPFPHDPSPKPGWQSPPVPHGDLGSTLLPAPSPLGYFGHDHTMYQFTLPHLETQSSGKNSLFRCGRGVWPQLVILAKEVISCPPTQEAGARADFSCYKPLA